MELTVTRLAILSRLGLVFFQFICNILIIDHDADAFRHPKDESIPPNYIEWTIELFFGGLRRWDSHHFLHIAEHGYTFEHNLAFYHFYPWIIRLVTNCFTSFVLEIRFYYASLLIATVLNVLMFTMAANVLYQITVMIYKKEDLAKKSVILFCFSPTGIFFTAPYTETIFALLSFLVIKYSIRDQFILLSIMLSLSLVTRSNGLLNIGYPLYFYSIAILSGNLNGKRILRILMKMIAISVSSWFIYQARYKFAVTSMTTMKDFPEYVVHAGIKNGYLLMNQWKINSLDTNVYWEIQEKYWGVKPFGYWQLKQIPNFLIALPVTYILIKGIMKFVSQLVQHSITGLNNSSGLLKILDYKNLTIRLLPFYMHIAFLIVFSWIFMHIQVTVRLIGSASPALYWIAMELIQYPHIIIRTDESQLCLKNELYSVLAPATIRKNWKVFGCFLMYPIVGTILFSNFLPWT